MARSKRGRQPGPVVGRKAKRVRTPKTVDLYEAEDSEPEEERFAGQRYDVSISSACSPGTVVHR